MHSDFQLKTYAIAGDVAKFRSQCSKHKMDLYPELGKLLHSTLLFHHFRCFTRRRANDSQILLDINNCALKLENYAQFYSSKDHKAGKF